jgi:hypothetical protein
MAVAVAAFGLVPVGAIIVLLFIHEQLSRIADALEAANRKAGK